MDDNNTIVLDVEDDDKRQTRIQVLLEKLNKEGRPPPASLPKFNFSPKTAFPVQAPSELLSRVQAFLPQIQASNEVLNKRAQEDPASVNIEHISQDVNQYIQMNLGLGVFEDRSKRVQDDHDTEMSSPSLSSSSEEVSQDSDVDSDASSEIITSFVPVRPIKPLPRRSLLRARPQITVLEGKSQE